ncbi:MAG: hypothetical protein V1495_05890 [Pseudomonadota bacterium]
MVSSEKRLTWFLVAGLLSMAACTQTKTNESAVESIPTATPTVIVIEENPKKPTPPAPVITDVEKSGNEYRVTWELPSDSDVAVEDLSFYIFVETRDDVTEFDLHDAQRQVDGKSEAIVSPPDGADVFYVYVVAVDSKKKESPPSEPFKVTIPKKEEPKKEPSPTKPKAPEPSKPRKDPNLEIRKGTKPVPKPKSEPPRKEPPPPLQAPVEVERMMIPRTSEPPAGSDRFVSKEDLNQHPLFPNESFTPIADDTLGTGYIDIGREGTRKFVLTRWDREKFPIVLRPNSNLPADYQEMMKQVIGYLNRVASELKITTSDTPLMRFGSTSDAPMAEYATHTIRFSERKEGNNGYAQTHLYVDPATGEIQDADIEIFFSAYKAEFEKKYPSELLIRRIRRTFLHELLHVLGGVDNFRGGEYDSYLGPTSDQKAVLEPKLSDERGKDYDRQVLSYLYIDSMITLEPFELVRDDPSYNGKKSPSVSTGPDGTEIDPAHPKASDLGLVLEKDVGTMPKAVIHFTDFYNACLFSQRMYSRDLLTTFGWEKMWSVDALLPGPDPCIDYLRKLGFGKGTTPKGIFASVLKEAIRRKFNEVMSPEKFMWEFRRRIPAWVQSGNGRRAAWFLYLLDNVRTNGGYVVVKETDGLYTNLIAEAGEFASAN